MRSSVEVKFFARCKLAPVKPTKQECDVQQVDCVIEAPVQAAVPVLGGGVFPVRRVFCIARNYAAHAREMGGDPGREAPFFFTKPADAVFPVLPGETASWPYPLASHDVHHEVELVVALHRGGEHLSTEQAAACVWGYAVGLDMTRRDLQAEAKAQGRPWDVAKAFDRGAPVSALKRAEGALPGQTRVSLRVNDVLRQQGQVSDMIWSVPEIIAALSRLFELKAGDLIFTGTPEGVGPVQPGDHLDAVVEGVGRLQMRVSGRA